MSNRIKAREVATILGGVAAGIAVSRLLPPLFASANGSVRARLGADPFEKLVNDHRLILGTLYEMERCTVGVPNRARLYLTLKRKLAKHALAEEDIVYPLLHDAAGRQEAAKHLYEEHADIKILLFETERLLKANADWTVPVTRLRGIIEKHAREEEEVQFPALKEALGRRKAKQLSGQIRREEAMVL